MHLFKHFLRLLLRNRTGLIIYGIITVIMAGMLMFVAGSNTGVDNMIAEVNSYDISYVDNDNSVVSRGLIDYLSQNNTVMDFSDKDETEISNMVFFYITEYHFTIPEGFGEAVESGSDENAVTYATDSGSNSYVSYDMSGRINSYLNAYRDFRKLGYDEEESARRAGELVSDVASMRILADENEAESASAKEIVLFNLNQYYPYLIMGMLVLGVGHTIMITNRKELIERSAVSPVSPVLRKMTNVIGLIVSGIVIWACFFGFNLIYGAGTNLVREYGWVIGINSFIAMLTGCAITALLTNFIRTTNTISMVTNIVGLSMSFFCGVFVPMRFLGDKVLAFAKFLPFYWTVTVNNMTSTIQSGYEFDMNAMLISFGIETLFAVAIAMIAVIGNPRRIIKE